MIPENALEEMTKNMDPNLVIVEGKEGVQMKWVTGSTEKTYTFVPCCRSES